ncbi:MAG: ribosome small subunit-dependent GTPase A [Lachnospiraceae bacterium]|nr:ribosome small subunit-dependent GTPase A [Lachnospiraceae bacterium]
MDLKKYGFMPDMMPENARGIPARITAVHKERYALVCEYGETYGRLKTKEYFGGFEEFPTTGDFVLINYLPGSDSQIIRTLPRKTFFSRRDPTPGRGEQAVASNFDYVFIMQSLNHDFNAKRLERYLTLAWQSGATPVVILTKADLVDNSVPYIRTVESYAAGVSVCAVSSKTGTGLNALSAYMSPGKTVVFLGSSGVGKSSLVNALADEDIMAVNDIREDDSKGRHTTTHRQLIMLKNGSMIIDTPGMRELGMWDVSNGLGEAFTDVEQYLGKCKFSDCKHQTEPGCAIKEAIANGELSRERWASYIKLKTEAKYSDNKSAFLRHKQQRNKNISKFSRQKKSENKRYGGDMG